MAVLTIRDKNQVTIPRDVLAQTGLRQGDPVEFAALPDGGIGIYPFGTKSRRRSVWDLALELASAVPGIEDTDLDLPERDLSGTEVVW